VATTRPSRPTSVKVALGLVAGQLAIGITQVLARSTQAQPGAALGLLVVLAIEVTVTGGLLLAMAYGRRWARIVYIVLVVLALPAMALGVLTPSQGSGGVPWSLTALACELGAVCLLLSRPTGDWFVACNARPSAPSAWYVDPSGRHAQRFWNGTNWTPHVADGGHVAIDPLE